MDIAIMIEGQNGLNWPRWKRIVELVEDWASQVYSAQTISPTVRHQTLTHWSYGFP